LVCVVVATDAWPFPIDETASKGERYSLKEYAIDREKYNELMYPHLLDLDRDI
tara:strand:+ start:27400 stop:27558 length:159 start_codon:yes stop_codon:yes gene_type:complete